MTKTYDLVTLYYKGHSPIKKEDNSYFLCLYTMLLVLFAMVVILLMCTFYNIEPSTKAVEIHHKPQPLKKTDGTTSTPTRKPSTSPPVDPNYYEDTAPPIVNWDKVVDFFVGPEETTGDPPVEDKIKATTLESTTTQKDVTSSSKKSVDQKDSHEESATFEAITADPGASKGTSTSSTDAGFNEWPEEATITYKDDLDGDVELVSTVQNSTFENKTSHFEVQKDCKSTRCGLAASKIMSSIDLSIEPCIDFYSFSCGGASRGGRPEPELSSEDSNNVWDFAKKFDWFQKSCMEHQIHFNYRDRIRRTKSVLSDIGMFNFDTEQNKIDLTEILANLVLLDAMPLFNFDVDVSNSTFILKLLPPDMKLNSKYWSPLAETRRNCLRTIQPDNTHPMDITLLYYDYEDCQKNHKYYFKSLETATEELGNFGNLTKGQRQKCIEDTTEFLRKVLSPMLNKMFPVSDLQDKIANLQYVQMNVQDMQKHFPIIDWHKFLKKVGLDEVKATSSIQIYDKSYFEMLFKKLSSLGTNKLMNCFNAILAEKYYQELVLPTPKRSRAKYCSKLSRKLLPDISNYLYRNFKTDEGFEERKNYIQALFQDMKQDYKNILHDLEWLDDKSRSSMINKINNLKLETYQDDLKNEAISLDKLYSELKLEQDDYSFNYIQATQFRRKTLFSLHGMPVTTVNTFGNFVDNLETEPVFFYDHQVAFIPDELVHETFLDLPKYIIMARIGFPLAKIIGHAFDPNGIKFGVQLSDNMNYLYDIFIQESRKTLPHHLDFKKLDLVFGLNNYVSNVERIAENTAMALLTNSIDEIQHQALLPWVSYTFSREKIFFMTLVQEFCSDISLMEFVVQAHEGSVLPPQFRVQNIIQNSEAFNAQFSCRPHPNLVQLQFPFLSGLIHKYNDKIT